MCRVIAVSNQKGGVGKTVSCVNLGIGLAQEGKKVLMIDADPQGSLTISLGYEEPDEMEYSLATLMMNIVNDEKLNIEKTILHHKEGVDLIPANIELSAIEVSLVNAMSRELILRSMVDRLREFYDYIIIDCMPSLGMMTINALACADSVERYPFDKELLNGIFDLILETVLCRNNEIVVASNKYPAELVRSKFLKLTSSHIEYAMGCMKSNTTKVHNIKKYLLATLFNAPSTISGYYQAEVNHDYPQFAVSGK